MWRVTSVKSAFLDGDAVADCCHTAINRGEPNYRIHDERDLFPDLSSAHEQRHTFLMQHLRHRPAHIWPSTIRNLVIKLPHGTFFRHNTAGSDVI